MLVAVGVRARVNDRLGDDEPRPRELLEGLVRRLEDVQVPDEEHVGRPRVLVLRAPLQELREGIDLLHARRIVGDGLAVEAVGGADREAEPARLHGDQHGRAGGLQHGLDPGVLAPSPLGDGRQHDAGGEPAELHLARVVEEADALVVAPRPLRDVRDEELPPRAEQLADATERSDVGAHLLHRDEVEGGDDLGDVVDRLGGAAAELRVAELPDVPGRQEQVAVDVLGRQLFRQRAAQPQQAAGRPPPIRPARIDLVIDEHAAPSPGIGRGIRKTYTDRPLASKGK